MPSCNPCHTRRAPQRSAVSQFFNGGGRMPLETRSGRWPRGLMRLMEAPLSVAEIVFPRMSCSVQRFRLPLPSEFTVSGPYKEVSWLEGDGTSRAFLNLVSLELGVPPSMVLAVAALLLQFQPVVPAVPAAAIFTAEISPAPVDKTQPADKTQPIDKTQPTDKTQPKPTAPATNGANAAASTTDTKSAGESSSNSSHLNLDSIYSDGSNAADKHPASLNAVSLDPAQKQFSNIRIPEPTPAKPYQIREAETMPSRRAWLVLSILEHSAAGFDAYSTREAVSVGAKEADPLMRPFAHSPAIYGALQVGPFVFDVMARHMQRSQYNILRRTWWLPQSLSTATSVLSGVHNLSVAGRL
jgi:hypothetical protein